ncbi:hypothetical protein NB705_003825 [Xanthomonas sacchari]|nr:hypothetical protein [Xanthomonas sacchari]
MRTQPHRIAARLHRHHDARGTDLGAQAFERGADGGGMVGEVVVNGDALRLAEHFQAPLDAAEARQRRHHLRRHHAHRMGGGQRGQRVHHVVAAEQRPVHLAQFAALVQHREAAAVGSDQTRAPVEAGIKAEALHRGPAAHRQHLAQVRVLAVDDQPPAARHGPHQMMKLALDRGDVGEDVGVVVFEVVEDRHQRPVVHELAALVEERGVVLVGLDHKQRAARQGRPLMSFSLREKVARSAG